MHTGGSSISSGIIPASIALCLHLFVSQIGDLTYTMLKFMEPNIHIINL